MWYVLRLVITTEEVLERSLIMFEEAKRTLHDQSNVDSLTLAAKRVTQVITADLNES